MKFDSKASRRARKQWRWAQKNLRRDHNQYFDYEEHGTL